MKSFYIATLGCRTNQADSVALRQGFLNQGYQEVENCQAAEVIVINSCTVARRSDQQVRQMVRRLRRENPDARLLVRNVERIRQSAQRQDSQAQRDPRVEVLLNRLERMPEESLNLEELARSVRLSVRQAQRIFKAATGVTITAFLNQVRLTRAAELLISDHELVSQIAYSLGYSTHEHFTRNFTAFFGMSPTAYRRLHIVKKTTPKIGAFEGSRLSL